MIYCEQEKRAPLRPSDVKGILEKTGGMPLYIETIVDFLINHKPEAGTEGEAGAAASIQDITLNLDFNQVCAPGVLGRGVMGGTMLSHGCLFTSTPVPASSTPLCLLPPPSIGHSGAS